MSSIPTKSQPANNSSDADAVKPPATIPQNLTCEPVAQSSNGNNSSAPLNKPVGQSQQNSGNMAHHTGNANPVVGPAHTQHTYNSQMPVTHHPSSNSMVAHQQPTAPSQLLTHHQQVMAAHQTMTPPSVTSNTSYFNKPPNILNPVGTTPVNMAQERTAAPNHQQTAGQQNLHHLPPQLPQQPQSPLHQSKLFQQHQQQMNAMMNQRHQQGFFQQQKPQTAQFPSSTPPKSSNMPVTNNQSPNKPQQLPEDRAKQLLGSPAPKPLINEPSQASSVTPLVNNKVGPNTNPKPATNPNSLNANLPNQVSNASNANQSPETAKLAATAPVGASSPAKLGKPTLAASPNANGTKTPTSPAKTATLASAKVPLSPAKVPVIPATVSISPKETSPAKLSPSVKPALSVTANSKEAALSAAGSNKSDASPVKKDVTVNNVQKDANENDETKAREVEKEKGVKNAVDDVDNSVSSKPEDSDDKKLLTKTEEIVSEKETPVEKSLEKFDKTDKPAEKLNEDNELKNSEEKETKDDRPKRGVKRSKSENKVDDAVASTSSEKNKRLRIPTSPFQVLPESRKTPKTPAIKSKKVDESAQATTSHQTSATPSKLVMFYKNEFLAVRNSESGFYICKAVQNVYKTSTKIRVLWLDNGEGASDTYREDFYDSVEFDSILTNVNLKRLQKGVYQLPAVELTRTDSILKRAMEVEKGGKADVDLNPEHPDGLDVSLFNDENQINKSPRKRKQAANDDEEAPKKKSTRLAKKKTPARSGKKKIANAKSKVGVGNKEESSSAKRRKTEETKSSQVGKRKIPEETSKEKIGASKATALTKSTRLARATATKVTNESAKTVAGRKRGVSLADTAAKKATTTAAGRKGKAATKNRQSGDSSSSAHSSPPKVDANKAKMLGKIAGSIAKNAKASAKATKTKATAKNGKVVASRETRQTVDQNQPSTSGTQSTRSTRRATGKK